MLGDLPIDEIRLNRLQCGERARFVRTHEAAVANDVSGKNSSQAALHVEESKPEKRTHRDRKSFRQMRNGGCGSGRGEPARRSVDISRSSLALSVSLGGCLAK